MNPMVSQLVKTFHGGSKCCLPVVLWSLAAWVLLLQAYTSLLRLPSHVPEPYSQWNNASHMFYRDAAEQTAEQLDAEMIENLDDNAQEKVEKVEKWNKLKENEDLEETFGAVAPVEPATTAKALEESKELLAQRRLAFLFPGKTSVIDPSKVNGSEYGYFYPGRTWLDSVGKPIQAHGGGVIYVAETQTFYWYGENKNGATIHPKQGTARVDVLGISCYSSKDLWTWNYKGLALKAERRDKSSDLYFLNVVERPKVIYNDNTKQYIMWMHIDNSNYSKASVGVAVSPNPEGPFEYVGSKRPHGCDSRDMTIFKDDDGQAYLIYSSSVNTELHIGPLTEDYMDIVERGSKKALVKQRREAPAVFKHRGMYYMVTSGCTSWAPNRALVHVAESMLGQWVTLGDPCVGGEEDFGSITFFSQGTFVLPLPGLENTFIFMADRWRPTDLRDSRYVWLPLTMDGPADTASDDEFEFPPWLRVSIHWYERWKLPEGWDNLHPVLTSL
ncbi:hypothetical protein BDL97_08G075500 [Sphagnum fallax]|nr:hypothetical protein BDL97_08G075500 [Sphagnum fallax]KAH8954360.1 hypothetical protein BDL97_08G075500 [Sphagnum fallax]